MTDTVQGPLVYLDANPIVYALEGPDELAAALKNLFSIFRSRPGIAVTSELTLAEVLPKKRIPDRQFFDLLIWSKVLELLPVTREILLETARYRQVARPRRSGTPVAMPKLPDSIHVVTAIRAGCGAFVSSDRHISLPVNMKLVQADKLGIETLVRELA